MGIYKQEISYFDWSLKFTGKTIFNKKTNQTIQKWEAYHLIKDFWEMVFTNTHVEFGCSDKANFNNGVYTGKRLKQVQYH